MTTPEKIAQLEQALQQRVDALAAADATCNRLLGRLDVLRELAKDESPVEEESPEE